MEFRNQDVDKRNPIDPVIILSKNADRDRAYGFGNCRRDGGFLDELGDDCFGELVEEIYDECWGLDVLYRPRNKGRQTDFGLRERCERFPENIGDCLGLLIH